MTTRKSLFFSFLDRYASLTINVVSSMVIARLLTPTEIGVFSVTMVLLMFVATVRDMGAGQYLVQERELTIQRIRAVWTVQLGLGLGLAAIVLALSYPVAHFYNEPRMRSIMLVVALNYAVNPFGSLTYAWLMREMRFERLALMRFSSALSGALMATGLAWAGFGPISLAFGSLTATVVNALVAVYFRPPEFPWLPGLAEIRRVLKFGAQLTASSVVAVFANGAPELLLGKLQSLTAAGLFSRSNGLVQMFKSMFSDAVSAVCLPWFAQQGREHGGFSQAFVKATAYVTAFGWSFCLAVICLAHPIMRILYGDQWDQAVDLARLLALAMLFSVPAVLCNIALLSSGAVKTIARVTVLSALQSVFFVALGATQGLMSLGLAMVVSSAVSASLWLQAAAKQIDLPLPKILLSLRSSALVALLSAVGPVLTLWTFGAYPQAVLTALLLGSIGAMLGFLAGIVIFGHPLRQELIAIRLRFKR